MFKLNKVLFILIILFVFLASLSSVASDDGSGSVVGGDVSPTENSSYGGDSNKGTMDSDDDEEDDPLDEEYYDSNDDVGGSAAGDKSVSVSLTKYTTGNPLFILFLALMTAGILVVRRY